MEFIHRILSQYLIIAIANKSLVKDFFSKLGFESMEHLKKLLWWLITGKRGGINRARIIKLLKDRPYNPNQLSKELDLSYKTVRHHIKILEENNIVKPTGDDYSKLYFLSDEVENNYEIFQEIWDKFIEK